MFLLSQRDGQADFLMSSSIDTIVCHFVVFLVLQYGLSYFGHTNTRCLVWHSSISVGQINVTTFGGSTIPVFIQATQPAVPLWIGAVSTGDGFGHLCKETAL